MRYVTYDSDGALTGSYIQELVAEHSENYLEVSAEQQVNWLSYKMSIDRKSLVLATISPSVAELKIITNNAINAWRLAANSMSFDYDGKSIACDALSRSDLDGMANYINLMGEFPAGWTGKWKASDNTYVDMSDVQDFKDMYAAMVERGHANFMHAQQLKAQLAAATTPEAVEAVKEALTNVQ